MLKLFSYKVLQIDISNLLPHFQYVYIIRYISLYIKVSIVSKKCQSLPRIDELNKLFYEIS